MVDGLPVPGVCLCRPGVAVNPANVHDCPMCGRVKVPIWRALCNQCYSITPSKFRFEYSHAYRCRVVNPVAWQEQLIEGRQWYVGRNLRAEGEAG